MLEESFEAEIQSIWTHSTGSVSDELGTLKSGLVSWAKSMNYKRWGLKSELTRKLEELVAQERNDANVA